jgi:hypothetical protein
MNAADGVKEAWRMLKKEAPSYLDPEIYDFNDLERSLANSFFLEGCVWFCQGIKIVYDLETKKFYVVDGAK